MPSHLLVVDWDFFFEEISPLHPDPEKQRFWPLYDWGHSETFGLIGPYGPVWALRAATFLSHGLALPGTTGEETAFWQRFTFTRNAQIIFAESNVVASFDVVRGRGAWSSLWLFDAHHDSGYSLSTHETLKRGTVTCEDWTLVYMLRDVPVHVRYPKWKTWAFDVERDYSFSDFAKIDRAFDDPAETLPRFSRVFVCRSGAWTPPWNDDAFMRFIDAAPFKKKRNIDVRDRVFNLDAARTDAEQLKRLNRKESQS